MIECVWIEGFELLEMEHAASFYASGVHASMVAGNETVCLAHQETRNVLHPWAVLLGKASVNV